MRGDDANRMLPHSGDEEEIVADQLKLLTTHRRGLAYLLEQEKAHGDRPDILLKTFHLIEEARSEIQRLKETLRSYDVQVENWPDDEAPLPPRRSSSWYLALAGLTLMLLMISAIAASALRGGASATPPSTNAPLTGRTAAPGVPSAVAQAFRDYSPKTAVAMPAFPAPSTTLAPGILPDRADLPVITRDNLTTLNPLDLVGGTAPGVLSNIRWSPDGAWVAATALEFGDGTTKVLGVVIYDRVTLQIRQTLPISARQETQLGFSPDSKLIACGATDGQISVWEVASGKLVATLRVSAENADSVLFTADGKALIGGAFDGTVKMWRTSDWHELRTLHAQGRGRFDLQLALSPDGSLLAADGQPITIWEVATGTEHSLGDGLAATYLRFVPDGRLVLLNRDSDDTEHITLVNPRDGSQLTITSSRRIGGFDFTADGATMITVGGGGWNLWDTTTGQQLMTIIGRSFGGNDFPISPDGHLMALTGDGAKTIALWGSLPGTAPRPALPNVADAVALVQPTVAALFTPPAGLEVIGPENVDRLAPFASIAPEKQTNGHANINSVRWSPDGRRLGVVTRGVTIVASGSLEANGVQVYDAASLQPICWANNSIIDSGVGDWSFSADGTLLATPRQDTIVVWEVDGCRERYTLGRVGQRGSALAFAPDGTLLAVSAADSSVHIWDLRTGQKRYVLREHRDLVYSVAFSRDGTLLASASNDGTVRLWDVASGQRVRILSGDTIYGGSPLTFWPDGKSLAVDSQIYDIATGKLRRTLKGCCGVISPDGRLMVAHSQIYDLAHWQELRLLTSSAISNGYPAFSPDGRLLTFAGNGFVEIWGVLP